MNLATAGVGLAILFAERFRAGIGVSGRFRLVLRTASLVALIGAIAFYPKSRQWMNASAERPTIWACIDVSQSMSTRDVVPDRLTRAKSILQSIVPVLDGFPVGVIAFAGDARIVCPPTSDLAFVEKSVQDLLVGSATPGGSNLLAPFERIDRLDRGGVSGNAVILLLSDGGHHSLPADWMTDENRRRMAIAIGIGNPAVSTPMPDSAGGFSTTTTRLEEAPLRILADRTGGAYIPARTSDFDGAGIVSRVLSTLVPQAYPMWSRHISRLFMFIGIVLVMTEPFIELVVYRRAFQQVGA